MEMFHLSELAERKCECSAHSPAIKYKDRGTGVWRMMDWASVARATRQIAALLDECSVGNAENVGIFSGNCKEYLIAELAVWRVGAVSVPMYATSSAAQVAHIVNHAQIRVLFVGDRYQHDIAVGIMPQCPTLEHIVIFDPDVKQSRHYPDGIHWSEVLQRFTGDEDLRHAPCSTMSILYTSGTTGESKGVILGHEAFLIQIRAHAELFPILNNGDTSLCFLPLAHIFEKAWTYFCLERGIVVCMNRNPVEVRQTLLEVRPSVMCAVPRFWEKVYHGVKEEMHRASPVRRRLMQSALATGRKYNIEYCRRGIEPPLMLTWKYQLFDKVFYSLLRRKIGIENGKIFPTAGAAIPCEVDEFVRSVGIPLLVGYGLTETMATVSLENMQNGQVVSQSGDIGSVGCVLPYIEIRIADNNEILLRGATITEGYYQNPAETAAAFTEDGFFRTGDAGYIKDGELYITERIKDLFKTSNGKYIAPAGLEAKLAIDRYIDQVAVIADGHKFVSALIVPEFTTIKEYARRNKITYRSLPELLRHPRILSLYKARIATLCQQFAAYEQIKAFSLLSQPFSIESGELTNTLKLRRKVIAQHYAAEIDKMYSDT